MVLIFPRFCSGLDIFPNHLSNQTLYYALLDPSNANIGRDSTSEVQEDRYFVYIKTGKGLVSFVQWKEKKCCIFFTEIFRFLVFHFIIIRVEFLKHFMKPECLDDFSLNFDIGLEEQV